MSIERIIPALGFIFIIGFSGFRASPTTVYFIPTLHGLHKTNSNYSYDSLRQVITRLKPDVIAVEIRKEDINQDSVYLQKNYPYEMRIAKYWFPKARVQGFDWIGGDIEGKLIPANYWQEISAIKKYQKELNADSIAVKRCSECNTYSSERQKLLQHLSLKELLISKDTLLTRQYYGCLANALKGSIHERVLNFYDLRNEKILENINSIIKKNKGKTIVILTGDDHYVYLKDRFKHQTLF